MEKGMEQSGLLNQQDYDHQQIAQNGRLQVIIACGNDQRLRKQFHERNYKAYCDAIDENWKQEYKDVRGWGLVKPVIELKSIAPLCRFPYHGHLKGCKFCYGGKRYYYEIIDKNQPIWALYFSMDLKPLWSKLKKDFPWWTRPQIQNNRYWTGTKKKLLKELEQDFLEEHPGPWVRMLNRAPGHITYAWGIHYNKTMEQIGVHLRWPPEPHPITVQILGRPLSDVDYSWGPFILGKLDPSLRNLATKI